MHFTLPLARALPRLAAAAILTFTPISGFAQEAGEKAAAEELFRTGLELIEAGKVADGCVKLEASQKLDAGVGTLLYLGDCYERLGRTASAWATFNEAASIAQSRGDSERSGTAHQRAQALEPKLSRLTIAAPPRAVEGLVVRLDGNPVVAATLGVALPVDPGVHGLEAIAPGREDYRTTITVEGAGASVEATIPELAVISGEASDTDAGGAGRAGRAAAEADEGSGSAQRTAGIIVGAVGVVALGVGGTFALLASSTNEDSLGHCAPEDATRCTPKGVALREDAQGQAGVATIAVIGGAAALGAGVVLYLTAPSGGEARGAAPTGLALSARLASSGAGAAVGGQW